MGALDDLRAGGFSESEISGFAAEKSHALRAGGFSDQEIGDYLGAKPASVPDTASSNRTFSRVLGDALDQAAQKLKPAGDTAMDIASVYAPIEGALNAATGLLFGFPAKVTAGFAGISVNHLLGQAVAPKDLAQTMNDAIANNPITAPFQMAGVLAGTAAKGMGVTEVDPAQWADSAERAVTWQPRTERGIRLTGNLMFPLQKLGEGAEWTGHQVADTATRIGATTDQAAWAGAITEQTIALLPGILLGEATRKMAGQRIGADDMANNAKIIAGDGAAPEAVQAAETSLRATYEKTGIGPYTVLEEAERNPSVKADLVDPAVEVPKAFEPYLEKPAIEEPRPGDGLPLLDVSGETAHEAMTMDLYRGQRAGSEYGYRQGGAVWMTKDPAEAKAYADYEGANGEVIQKTVELKKPFVLNDDTAEKFAQYFSNPELDPAIDAKSVSDLAAYIKEHGLSYIDATVRDKLIADGYDSIIPEKEGGVGKSNAVVLLKRPEEMLAADHEHQQFVEEVQAHAGDVKDIAVLDRPPRELLEAAGLDDSPANRVDVAMVARAATLDEGAFIRAAIEHEGDEAAFMNSIKEIIRNGEDAGAEQLYPDGTVELHAGINVGSAVRDFAGSYTPFVGVEQPHAGMADRPVHVSGDPGYSPSPIGDALRKVFAPASRGPIAEKQAGIMRANFGEMAREQELALEGLKKTAAAFDKMPVEKNIAFIDAMERDAKIDDPKAAEAATELRTLLDTKRDEVRALGKGQLENFDANYFPHIWKQQDEAAWLFSRRPLEGSKAFLKQRTIPYTTDGLRWRAYDADGDFLKSFDTEAEAKAAMPTGGRIGDPLTPITSNPVELALLKAREMDRYIYGQRIFQEMKDTDMARFVPFGDRALPGWTKIDDKIARVWSPSDAGGMILRGDYYAPDEAATLINNHLSSGLRGNNFYDAWRGIGTALNGAQLGLSLFHVGFTTMDSMISKVSLGVKQISRGDILEGAGNIAQGLNPAQPFVNIYKGDRLLRAYLGKLDDPSMTPIVDAIQQAGGRVKMDDFYRNTTVNAFKQAVRAGDIWSATKAFLPTVLDRIGAPIFEQLVPRQKLGVFFDMAKDWLENNPDAGVELKRSELGKLWDSVDNRMGQLVYDNVFWNRSLKDGLMATVRSVGWNLGTFRELGGGVLDIKDVMRNKGFSDRTAYVVALPMVAAIYGSVLHYLYNGQGPETLKDAFYPRTGRYRPDGSEDRISLPTYMKDVFAYGEDATNFAKYGTDPLQTLKNKSHPLISVVSQMLSNQDFFGAAIRNPSAPAVSQVADEAAFLFQQISPFSLRNYLQQAKTRGEQPTVIGYLTDPSMVGVTPAPGYIVKTPEEQESAMVSRLHDSLLKKFVQELKNGGDSDKIVGEMINAGMSKQDIKRAFRSSTDTPLPHRLKHFATDEQQ